MTTDTLRARVEQAQALAAAATPGPWRSEGDTMTGGMDYRYVMVPLPVGTSVASGIIARCSRFGAHAHEAAANADLMAAAPDLVALITDLWAAYMAACDRADGRDRLEADVRRLTVERDSLRSQVGEASHVLTAALCGEERAGEQAHLPALARMMVDALTLEAANAEQARMQLDNGDDVDAATRRYLGEALGIADSDDTPPSLSDFYDAVVEARAERDAALAEVARLRGEAEALAVAGGRGLVWIEGGRGWHLSRSGRDWWTTAPYSAWRDGYATTDDVLGRVTRCANCPNACRQIAAWARADGHTVPPHPLGWDVGVSDG